MTTWLRSLVAFAIATALIAGAADARPRKKSSRTKASRADQAAPLRAVRAATYANCSDARARGAAPVRRGDPGYSRKLDRDNDGVGCE